MDSTRTERKIIPLRTIAIMLLFVCLYGCASRELKLPELNPINDPDLPDIYTKNSLCIINNQKSNKLRTYFHFQVIDYNQWTQRAVDLLTNEFKKKGVVVSDNGEKMLKVAVTEARMTAGMWAGRIIITLKCETGDGYTQNYHVEKISSVVTWATPWKTLQLAIIDLLNDEKIITYLTKDPMDNNLQ